MGVEDRATKCMQQAVHDKGLKQRRGGKGGLIHSYTISKAAVIKFRKTDCREHAGRLRTFLQICFNLINPVCISCFWSYWIDFFLGSGLFEFMVASPNESKTRIFIYAFIKYSQISSWNLEEFLEVLTSCASRPNCTSCRPWKASVVGSSCSGNHRMRRSRIVPRLHIASHNGPIYFWHILPPYTPCLLFPIHNIFPGVRVQHRTARSFSSASSSSLFFGPPDACTLYSTPGVSQCMVYGPPIYSRDLHNALPTC